MMSKEKLTVKVSRCIDGNKENYIFKTKNPVTVELFSEVINKTINSTDQGTCPLDDLAEKYLADLNRLISKDEERSRE